MLAFILRRIVIAIPTVILISVFVFALQKLLPGDPVLVMAGEDRTPEMLDFLREKYRLNDPIPVQYRPGSAMRCGATSASRSAPTSRSPS
jgi:peptide/nickel transport system permease protein